MVNIVLRKGEVIKVTVTVILLNGMTMGGD